jgi:ankyrin repeat protein
MLDSIVYFVQSNGFHLDTIPILFTNKSFYNNLYLWMMIVNSKRNLTPLMASAFNNKASRVKFLLEAGANVNMIDNSYQSAILYAFCGNTKHSPHKCQDCNLEIIKELCNHEINLNLLDIDGENPIMNATRLGYTEAVKIFCEYGFDINYTNVDGKTAMSIAIETNHPEICYYLWKKGADINTIDHKKHSFLMTLIYNNATYEMVEDVLKHNPNIDMLDANGANALMYACINGDEDKIELLIRYGADVNYPMLGAIFKNKIDVVRMLCVNKSNLDYSHMIKYAKKLKHSEIEKLLFQKLKTK